MITLNAPVAPPSIVSYDVIALTLDFASQTVTIGYAVKDGGGNTLNSANAPPLTHAQFNASPGANIRLKALNALATALGLAGGTYTVA